MYRTASPRAIPSQGHAVGGCPGCCSGRGRPRACPKSACIHRRHPQRGAPTDAGDVRCGKLHGPEYLLRRLPRPKFPACFLPMKRTSRGRTNVYSIWTRKVTRFRRMTPGTRSSRTRTANTFGGTMSKRAERRQRMSSATPSGCTTTTASGPTAS